MTDKQLKLWFFRDLTDEQRLKLFKLTMPEVPSEQFKSHVAQADAFWHLIDAIRHEVSR